ncbi:hypothetical protein HYV73_00945 [Candidatus Uhrbacteria bacterium]|nr:hypothetical protein [Candidatus Uhrbacteria bacterium]
MPKTEEGKAVSRLNAISHGLLSQEVFLEGENQQRLDDLSTALRDEMQPVGELEAFLVDRMSAEMWRMRRAMAAERKRTEVAKQKVLATMFPEAIYGTKEAVELAAETALPVDPDTEKIMRYATAIERSFYRALHEFQRLQASRNGLPVPTPSVLDVNAEGFGDG